MKDFPPEPQLQSSRKSQTAPNYGEPEHHPEIGMLATAIYALRDEEDGQGCVADSTLLYAIEALLRLPASVPAPDIEVDEDGIIEFEWAHEGQSFSVYITDTKRTAFAGYFGPNDVLSGYQDAHDIFEGDDLYHIRKVFRPTTAQWMNSRK